MKTVSESEMMMSKMSEEISKTEGIEIPIQNLFDECLKFISVNDFNF